MVHPAFEDEIGHMRLVVRQAMLLDDCFMKISRAQWTRALDIAYRKTKEAFPLPKKSVM